MRRGGAEDLRGTGSLLGGRSPYSSYRYLNVIAEGGGGLEHKDCALMLSGRWSWGDEDRAQGMVWPDQSRTIPRLEWQTTPP